MHILALRKSQYDERQPAITNVLSMPELIRFGERGLADSDASATLLARNRAMARLELQRIADMLAKPPLGVQIGLFFDELPTTSFSLVRQRAGSVAMISPFRLGPAVNVWRGVGMISQAPEAVRLYTQWAKELWGEVVTGERAAKYLRRHIPGE